MVAFKISRRTFLRTGFAVITAALLTGAASFLTGKTQEETIVTDSFAKGKSYPPGSVTLGEREAVWLVRDEKGFFALDRRCPHLGCLVQWDAKAKQFVCPCHFSKYGPDGRVLSGPATRPMVPVRLKLDNRGVLVADLNEIVPRNWRFNF